MKKREVGIFIFLVILLCVLLVIPVAANGNQQVIGQPQLSVVVSENQVSVGSETTIEFYLLNRGTIRQSGPTEYTERVTTARAVNVQVGNPDAPLSVNTQSVPIGNVPTGVSGPHEISITIPDSASTGTYNVPIDIKYQYTYIINYGGGETEFVDRSSEKEAEIPLNIEDQARFEIVQNNASARIGSSSDISVTIRNTGTEAASDISVAAASRSEKLSIGEGERRSATGFVDKLEPGESRTITYNAEFASNAPERNYTVDVNVDYTDSEGINQTANTLQFPVRAEPEQSFSLSDIQSTLRAGEDGQLEATLTNTGEEAVENLVLNWDSEHSNLSPQETQYAVGRLEPGASTTVSFGVDASDSARAGPRQFDFVAGYQDDSGDTKRSDPIQIRAEVAPDRDEFELEPANTSVAIGSTQTIDITITNTREVPLTDISAQLFADSPISAEDDEAFVSSLAPGQSTTLTFSVSAEGGALEKPYPISLDFQYEEPDGDTPISDTYQVGIDVTQPDNGGGLPILPIVAVLVVLVVGVGGYLRFR